jgi:hypothetical protein
VKNTIDVCQKYFDTIRVVNTGPIELEKQFQDLPSNVVVETLNFYCGDLEASRNCFLYDVDINDYVLWLDSDERPTQYLLNNLKNIIHTCESSNSFIVRFPFIPHHWDAHTNVIRFPVGESCKDFMYNFDSYPIDHADWCMKSIRFHTNQSNINPNVAVDRFFKKTRHQCSAVTNFGGHGGIYNTSSEEPWVYVRYPICHYKPDIAIYQSATTSVYFNPCINISISDGVSEYLNSEEYKILREFQKRTGVITQNDLCYKLHLNLDKQFKDEFKLLCENSKFVNSTLLSNLFTHWSKWSTLFDLSWETPHVYCGGECCKHENLQF